MSTSSANRELEAFLSDLPYLREWRLAASADTKELRMFVVFRNGGTLDRLESALKTAELVKIPIDVAIVSHLPRMPEGSVDEHALLALEREPTAVRPQPHDRLARNVDAVKTNVSQMVSPALLSFLSGGEHKSLPSDRTTLAEALEKAAERTPLRGIRLLGFTQNDEHFSYAELLDAALRVNGGLTTQRAPWGIPVLLFTDDASMFLRLAWGCFVRGNPVLPSARPADDLAKEKLLEVLARFPAAMFLSLPTDQAFAMELQHRAPHVRIYEGEQLLKGPACAPPPVEPEQLSMLLMTSGSTARPKLVMQTHQAVLSYCLGASQMNGFSHADVSFNWFPLDHVGGLVMSHIRDVWLGCDQLQAKTDWILADPTRWLDILTKYSVTVSWAPNFAYALINTRIQKSGFGNLDLSSVRVLINGGEMIVPEQAALFLRLLQSKGLRGSTLRPAWGMSETCSGVLYSTSFTQDDQLPRSHPVRVGTPICGVKLRIVGPVGEIVHVGTVGSLELRGAPVTIGYYGDESANQLAFTDDGWFRTGDIASIEDDQVVIRGRAAEKIIINGKNYSAQEVEATLRSIAGVEPSSVTAMSIPRPNGDTEGLVVAYAPAEGANVVAAEAAIRSALITNYGLAPTHVLEFEISRIPRGPIGKVLRTELRTLVQAQLAQSHSDLTGVPAWFARPTYVPKALDVVERSSKSVLWLSARDNINQAFRDRAEQHGYRVIALDEHFREDSPTSDTSDPAAWRRILRTVPAAALEAVVISAVPGHDGYLDAPVRSLTVLRMLAALLKAWHEERRTDICRLQVLGDIGLAPNEHQHPDTAAIAAWLKSAAAEFGWLRPKVISLRSESVPDLVVHLFNEIRDGNRDEEVIYFGNKRVVPAFEPVDPTSIARTPNTPIRTEGFYLLTGGLGAIGTFVSSWLLKSYRAKLVLVGRTDLLANTIAAHARRERLSELQNTGPVAYEVCDISNSGRLSEVVAKWENRYATQLHGVFHLAGVLSRGGILNQDHQSLIEAFHPKAAGFQAVINLIAKRPAATMIGFSSVNGYFGGAQVSAHAAASAYQNASLARARTQHTCYSISWSAWPGIGQGPASEEMRLAAERGYSPIDSDSGIASMATLLSRPPDDWLVGIDPKSDKLSSPLGTRPVMIDSVRVQVDPTTAKPASASTGTALATALTQIWSDTLELPEVGLSENFFDIGGTSLLVPRIREQVLDRLGIDMPTVEIFKYPTIAALSNRLSQIAAATHSAAA